MRMDDRSLRVLPPILRDKHYSTSSAFTPESLLREARRQKDVPDTVPILHPRSGRDMCATCAPNRARPVATWACYHSTMDRFDDSGREYGIVGCRRRTLCWWPSNCSPPAAVCFSASLRQARLPRWVRSHGRPASAARPCWCRPAPSHRAGRFLQGKARLSRGSASGENRNRS